MAITTTSTRGRGVASSDVMSFRGAATAVGRVNSGASRYPGFGIGPDARGILVFSTPRPDDPAPPSHGRPKMSANTRESRVASDDSKPRDERLGRLAAPA